MPQMDKITFFNNSVSILTSFTLFYLIIMFFLALFISVHNIKIEKMLKVMSYLIQLLNIIKEKNLVLRKLLKSKK
jgi:hypothetical protein